MLENDDSIQLAGNSISQIRFIGFNPTREPFTDVRVRQAVSMAVDRGPIIEAALFGYGTPVDIIFTQDHWAALPRPEIPPPDIEGAIALLAEAGFPDGFDTTITGWAEYGFLSDSAIVVQEQAEANRHQCRDESARYGNHGADRLSRLRFRYRCHRHERIRRSRFGDSREFQNRRGRELCPVQQPGGRRADRRRRRADRPGRACRGLPPIQEILLEELPWVNLYVGQQYEAMKTFVMGYEHIPTGSNKKVREVWLDQ